MSVIHCISDSFSFTFLTILFSFTVRIDIVQVNLYSYGLKDPGHSSRALSKILVYGKRDSKLVYEYKTQANIKRGFLFVILNKFSGLVEFEAK